MAFAYARLLEITTIPGTTAAVYTNPAATTTYIRLIVIHNANTTAETVILWNVPDNAGSVGTAGDTNRFFYKVMAPGETVILEFPAPGILLSATNDTIQGDTNTSSKVTIQIMGATEA